MTAEARRGFPIGLTISVAIAFAILVALGTWQVQRLKWKEGLLARIDALQHAPARPLGPVLDDLARGADGDFVRVTAICPGLSTAPYLELYAIREGQAGVRLVSACGVAAARYRSILVDRGFVPLSRKDKATRAQGEPQGPVTVVGVLRWPESRGMFTPADDVKGNVWYLRDPAAMAAVLHWGNVAPFYVDQESPVPPGGLPAPGKLVVNLPDNHLQYAITWFGLGAALIGVYGYWLFGRFRKPA